MTDCVYKRNPEHPLIPRKEIEAHPWAFKCNAPSCFWVTCHNDQADAERTRDRHIKESCPHNSGVKKGIDRMTIQHKIWDRLDEATAAVMTGKPAVPLEQIVDGYRAPEVVAELFAEWTAFNEKRGNARGLAAAIFELNVPSFETVTDVAKLAVQRYKAKNSDGEIEMPLTPGYDYSPQVAENRNRQETARAKAAPAKKAAPKKAAAPAAKGADRELTDGELGSLKNGINAKLPFASLASVYKISEARVQQIADELAATPS